MSAGGWKSLWQQTRPFRQRMLDLSVGAFALSFFAISVCGATICEDPNMAPTIDSRGELLLVYKWNKHKVERGDVVISIRVDDPKRTECRRIKGLENDVRTYRDSSGALQVETILPGHVWLESDNHACDDDSRRYGPVPIGLLQGRVLGKISVYPYFHIGRVDTIRTVAVTGGDKQKEGVEIELDKK